MVIRSFPSVSTADEHGLLAIGGDLEVASLLLAYKSGIFPWPISEDYLTWFSPPQRAVLFLNEVHLSKSFQKFIKNTDFTLTVNKKFEDVIRRCAEPVHRGEQEGTWVTEEIIQGYIDFHKAGYAFSVECNSGAGELVGGLYGVTLAGFVAGESMFYRRPNASKLCLHYLIEQCRSKGVQWIDCQVQTPLLSQFGAKEISRIKYIEHLNHALMRKECSLFT